MSARVPIHSSEPQVEAVLWIAPGCEATLWKLGLYPPCPAGEDDGGIRVLRSGRGTLVHAALSGEREARRARSLGVRLFRPDASRKVWREWRVADPSARGEDEDTVPSPAQALRNVARRGGTVLIESSRLCRWTVEPPPAWSALHRALEVREEAATSVERASRAVLRLTPVSPGGPVREGGAPSTGPSPGEGGRAGMLLADEEWQRLRRGELPAAHAERETMDLRGVWVFRTSAFVVLFSPRGLLDAFPSVGRPLRNLAGGLEPVLVPRDRRPEPRLSARQVRAVFGVDEGLGLLWWDVGEGERFGTFHRTQLVRLLDALPEDAR